jgi:hypothetical protein
MLKKSIGEAVGGSFSNTPAYIFFLKIGDTNLKVSFPE